MRGLIRAIGRPLRPLLYSTLYRPGTTARILMGPSRGLRYTVFPGWSLAHLYGGYEPEIARAMTAHLRPGGVAYDLGANHGLHTLLMAKRVGPTGHVYAFEPVPVLYQAMVNNVRLNRFDHVTPVRQAVADAVGEATLYTGHHESVGHLATAGAAVGESMIVQTTTLDAFVAAGHHPPNFIKIDVEGAEGAVLAGAREVLASHKPLLLVELHTPEQDAAVAAALKRHGYTARRLDPAAPPAADLGKCWPDPAGVWGQILAVPAN